MAERLQLIKDLRAKGASIKMIDDVAIHVGGYDSPIFVATVEFIIKIKNMMMEIQRQPEQEVAITEDFAAKNRGEMENVNVDAAKSAVSSDDELPEDERKLMLKHLEMMEIQRESFLELEQYRQGKFTETIAEPSEKRKKSNIRRTAKPSLLDKLLKNNLLQQALRRRAAIEMEEDEREASQQAAQQATRQAQKNSQSQTALRSNLVGKMGLIKMKLLAALKPPKDFSVYGNEQFRQNLKQNEPQKNQKQNEKQTKEARQEILISDVIDKAVKANKEAKVEVAETKKAAEKGQFEAKVAEKTGPRANEENVAKMMAQEAIAKLQNSGVKESAGVALKKEMVELTQTQQTAQQNQQNPQNTQKQR